MMIVSMLIPGGWSITFIATSTQYKTKPAMAQGRDPFHTRQPTTPNKPASRNDHGDIPMIEVELAMPMTVNSVVRPATTYAHPPATWAALRAESSSTIPGHAQFAIASGIVVSRAPGVNWKKPASYILLIAPKGFSS